MTSEEKELKIETAHSWLKFNVNTNVTAYARIIVKDLLAVIDSKDAEAIREEQRKECAEVFVAYDDDVAMMTANYGQQQMFVDAILNAGKE